MTDMDTNDMVRRDEDLFCEKHFLCYFNLSRINVIVLFSNFNTCVWICLPEKDAILKRTSHVLKWKICIGTSGRWWVDGDKVSQTYFKTPREPINQMQTTGPLA